MKVFIFSWLQRVCNSNTGTVSALQSDSEFCVFPDPLSS